jgi:hypothetical protein
MIGNRVHSGLFGDQAREGFAEGRGTYYLVDAQKTSPAQQLSKAELATLIVHWDAQGSLN